MGKTKTDKKRDRHKALPRAKEQIKILEDTVSRQDGKIGKLESENEKLKKEGSIGTGVVRSSL